MSEQNIARILDYLNANAAHYGLETLRTQLLAAGYAEQEIAAAITRFEQAQSAPQPVAPTIPLPSDPAATTRLSEPDRVEIESPPQLPQSDDRQAAIARARAYIEANRDRYELEALRGTLVQSGYADDVIAAALTQIGPVKQPRRKRNPGDGPPPTWPFGLLVMVANYVAISLFLTLEVAVVTNGIIFGIGTLLVLGGETVAWFVLRRGPRERLGRILVQGALFTVLLTFGSVAILALLIGACLAVIGAF
ncbi:MAG: hypothetical protein HC822_07470 [Oscillochloris sp.]|nr:hypothetical protein [Oscillochloris sp.]